MKKVCKRNCKRTTPQHGTGHNEAESSTQKCRTREHTLGYAAARANTQILELENRCTGNRTVGSTLSTNFTINQ